MNIDINNLAFLKKRRTMELQKCSELRDAFIASARKKGLDLTEAISAVADVFPALRNQYLARKAGECADDRRGIFLAGEPGNGKTVALMFLSALCGYSYLRAIDLGAKFSAHGEAAFWDTVNPYARRIIILDDLGAERDLRSYGNASPISEWLQRRYNAWQLNGPVIHIATNVGSDTLVERYGFRLLDRIYEMCVLKTVKARTMRRAEPCPK